MWRWHLGVGWWAGGSRQGRPKGRKGTVRTAEHQRLPLAWGGGGMGGAHLLVDLLSGLCVTEGHGGQVLQDGHLHGAVSPIEQRHQGAGVQGAVHDLGADACEDGRVMRQVGRVACPPLVALLRPHSHLSAPPLPTSIRRTGWGGGRGDPTAPSLLPGPPGFKDRRLLGSHWGRFRDEPRRPRENMCPPGLSGWGSEGDLGLGEPSPMLCTRTTVVPNSTATWNQANKKTQLPPALARARGGRGGSPLLPCPHLPPPSFQTNKRDMSWLLRKSLAEIGTLGSAHDPSSPGPGGGSCA